MRCGPSAVTTAAAWYALPAWYSRTDTPPGAERMEAFREPYPPRTLALSYMHHLPGGLSLQYGRGRDRTAPIAA